MTILTFYYNSLFSDCSLQLKLNNTTIEIPIHKVIMSASSKYIFEFCKTNMDCKKIEIPQIDEKCEDNEKKLQVCEPISLFFGNEAHGLDKETRKLGANITIAHSHDIDSLNLAMSVGIALFYLNTKF